MPNRNLDILIAAAKLLTPILDELVFVGGCVTGLLITDEAAADVRATIDVDAIAEITSYPEYAKFSERLQKLGFVQDTTAGAPICRWLHGDTTLDVMPLDEKILGFSNPWYRSAMERAQEIEIEDGLRIRVVTAADFSATKLQAFHGRGRQDYLASPDLEDFIAVVDGRPELLAELRSAPEDVRSFIARGCGRLLDTERFIDALPGYLQSDAASQGRIAIVLERLQQISAL